MVICLEQGANHLCGPADATAMPIISCFIKIQNGSAFLDWLTQVILAKKGVKRL